MVPVLFVNFSYFSPIVPFLLQNIAVFPNGTFFASQFRSFSEIVPFLPLLFCTFLNWYHFLVAISIILWNGTIFVSNKKLENRQEILPLKLPISIYYNNKKFVALITIINEGLHKLRYIIHKISYIVIFNFIVHSLPF